MSFESGVCVACHTKEEVFLFETFAGSFQSACCHAACQSCLQSWVLGSLPHCRRTWQLRVPCLSEDCSRSIPQSLVLQVAAARTLAHAIDSEDATWPRLPEDGDGPACPRCRKVREKVYVNKACGHGACEECWLADLEPKLKWCEANCTLDIPCGFEGCPEGCSDVLSRSTKCSGSFVPQVAQAAEYVEKVRTDMYGFSAWCVHDGPPCTPGPVCPVCMCRTVALLYCSCGHAACKRCWEAVVEVQLHWCKEHFAFTPAEPLHGTCKSDEVLSFLAPDVMKPLHLHAQELHKQLQLVKTCALPRGNEGPTCPICNEIALALLCGGSHEHHEHHACEDCWVRWAEEQLEECFLYKRAPFRCLWPSCAENLARDGLDGLEGLWQLIQRSSSKLHQLMDGLRRRKRLQNNPMYPAEFHVECPLCLGLGYRGQCDETWICGKCTGNFHQPTANCINLLSWSGCSGSFTWDVVAATHLNVVGLLSLTRCSCVLPLVQLMCRCWSWCWCYWCVGVAFGVGFGIGVLLVCCWCVGIVALLIVVVAFGFVVGICRYDCCTYTLFTLHTVLVWNMMIFSFSTKDTKVENHHRLWHSDVLHVRASMERRDRPATRRILRSWWRWAPALSGSPRPKMSTVQGIYWEKRGLWSYDLPMSPPVFMDHPQTLGCDQVSWFGLVLLQLLQLPEKLWTWICTVALGSPWFDLYPWLALRSLSLGKMPLAHVQLYRFLSQLICSRGQKMWMQDDARLRGVVPSTSTQQQVHIDKCW